MLMRHANPAQIYLLELVLNAGIAGSAALLLSWRESSNSAAAKSSALPASGCGLAALRSCEVAGHMSAMRASHWLQVRCVTIVSTIRLDPSA